MGFVWFIRSTTKIHNTKDKIVLVMTFGLTTKNIRASLFIVNTEYSHLNTINYQFFEDTSRDL